MENDNPSIITLLSEDIDNMNNIKDLYIIECSSETSGMVDMFSKTEIITSQNKGLFTEKLNHKYVILSKEGLKPYCKEIVKFLINIKDSFQSIKDVLSLFNLCNIFLLIASGNTTIYNIKKKILIYYGNSLSMEMIINEMKFTQIISVKNRKSAISWDYREFLMEMYWNQLIEYYNHITIKEVNTHICYFSKAIDQPLNITNFIMSELEYMVLVNNEEKRNYHLWTYLNKLLKKCTLIDDKKAIVFFALGLFINCFNDYSAFSFIINFYNTIGLSQVDITNIKTYLSTVSAINNNNNNNKYYTLLFQEMTDQHMTRNTKIKC